MSSVHDGPSRRQARSSVRRTEFRAAGFVVPSGHLTEEQAARLRAEIGFPAESLFCHCPFNLAVTDPKLEGWVYEVMGEPTLEANGKIRRPEPRHPPLVFLYFQFKDARGDLGTYFGWPPEGFAAFCEAQEVVECERVVLRPWAARVYPPGSSLFAEVRWHPDLGWRRSIGGLEHPHKPEDAARADRGFGVMDRLSLVGRPQDSPEAALDEMAEWLLDYLRRHPGIGPEIVGWSELQEVSGLSMPGLNKRKNNKGIRLKAVRQRAERIAREDPRWSDILGSFG